MENKIDELIKKVDVLTARMDNLDKERKVEAIRHFIQGDYKANCRQLIVERTGQLNYILSNSGSTRRFITGSIDDVKLYVDMFGNCATHMTLQNLSDECVAIFEGFRVVNSCIRDYGVVHLTNVPVKILNVLELDELSTLVLDDIIDLDYSFMKNIAYVERLTISKKVGNYMELMKYKQKIRTVISINIELPGLPLSKKNQVSPAQEILYGKFDEYEYDLNKK